MQLWINTLHDYVSIEQATVKYSFLPANNKSKPVRFISVTAVG